MPVLVDKRFDDTHSDRKISVMLVRRAVRETLRAEGVPLNGEVSVVLAGDEFIHELNREYMGVDAPTDVLSFPQEEEVSPGFPPAGPRVLGDIVVSIPAVERQSLEHQVSVEQELVLLLAHATLHLLGYDHQEEESRAVMWRRQEMVVETVMKRAAPASGTARSVCSNAKEVSLL